MNQWIHSNNRAHNNFVVKHNISDDKTNDKLITLFWTYLGLAFVLMLRPFFPELAMSTDLCKSNDQTVQHSMDYFPKIIKSEVNIKMIFSLLFWGGGGVIHTGRVVRLPTPMSETKTVCRMSEVSLLARLVPDYMHRVLGSWKQLHPSDDCRASSAPSHLDRHGKSLDWGNNTGQDWHRL